MFISSFHVEEHEAEYIVEALAGNLPASTNDAPRFSTYPSMALGQAEIEIRTKEPLTLAQRRFLVAHGFQVHVEYREE